jgi:hypothetical protein
MKEIPLRGGKVSSPVQIGQTVHRMGGAWTPTVHALLRYLVEHGFSYAPRPLGVDEQGREILAYLPGASVHRPWMPVLKTEAGLVQVAQMVRRYHDVVAGFEPPVDAVWRIGKRVKGPGQIIRHGDLGPWNTLWQGETLTALLDWDLAEPADRITDVAQMAWYFVPLRGERGWREAGFAEPPDYVRRVQVLCDAYGAFSVPEVLQEVDRLQRSDMEITQRLGGGGVHPWSLFWNRGGMELLASENAWLQQYLEP